MTALTIGSDVFPARAGMILGMVATINEKLRIPRESGDDPADLTKAFRTALYSPRERG